VLALAAQYEMDVYHLDVTTAFLNGELKESVYMEMPEYAIEALQEITRSSEIEDPVAKKAKSMLEEITRGNNVCLLKRALYGLKQAGRCWNDCIDNELRRFGAKRTDGDHCVYTKGSEENLVIIALYVDDIVVASKDEEQIQKLERHLRNKFELTNHGRIQYCLGMEFSAKRGKICIR